MLFADAMNSLDYAVVNTIMRTASANIVEEYRVARWNSLNFFQKGTNTISPQETFFRLGREFELHLWRSINLVVPYHYPMLCIILNKRSDAESPYEEYQPAIIGRITSFVHFVKCDYLPWRIPEIILTFPIVTIPSRCDDLKAIFGNVRPFMDVKVCLSSCELFYRTLAKDASYKGSAVFAFKVLIVNKAMIW